MIVSDRRSDGDAPHELIPAGVHHAVVYRIVHVGTMFKPKFNPPCDQNVVRIEFEVPRHRLEVERDGQTMSLPMAISKDFTYSIDERANLSQMIEAILGRSLTPTERVGFELETILGANCQIQVYHKPSTQPGGRTFANIKMVMGLPEGTPLLKAENPLRIWDIDDGTPIPNYMPGWLSEQIQSSNEFKARTEAALSSEAMRRAVNAPVQQAQDPLYALKQRMARAQAALGLTAEAIRATMKGAYGIDKLAALYAASPSNAETFVARYEAELAGPPAEEDDVPF